MKTTIKKTNNLGMILVFIWTIFILLATGYVVFVLERSAWWFLVGILLLSGSMLKEETIIES